MRSSVTNKDKEIEQKAYKLQRVHISMRLHKLLDVSIPHPLRNHHEPILVHCHPQQRQHVWMTEGPPSYDLLAEPLWDTVSMHIIGQGELTFVVFSKSLVMYTLRTLAATSLPPC